MGCCHARFDIRSRKDGCNGLQAVDQGRRTCLGYGPLTPTSFRSSYLRSLS